MLLQIFKQDFQKIIVKSNCIKERRIIRKCLQDLKVAKTEENNEK